jgi:hypothetical protein
MTSPAFQSAAANAKAFEASMASSSYSMKEARGAAMLFSEEIGVHMNRHLVAAAAGSELLGKALAAAFPVIAAVGFIEVAMRIPGVLQNAFAVASGLKAEDAMIEANSRLEESLHGIAEATAKAAAAYARLGQSAQTVALMDRADASSVLISKQAELALLKSMLTAQQALSTQTERVSEGPGQAPSFNLTEAATTAQEMIPGLTDKIRTLENKMEGFKIAAASAGKMLDSSLTDAFDKAAEKAKRLQDILERVMAEAFKMSGTDWQMRAHGSSPQFPIQGPQQLGSGVPGGSPQQFFPGSSPDLGSPSYSALYTGSAAAMNLAKIQTDQSASIAAAEAIYNQTATAAQKYGDTPAVLNTLLHQVDASTGMSRISQQQYDAALKQADALLNKASMKEQTKDATEFGRAIGSSLEKAVLFQESWSKAFRQILDDVVKLILQMYVFQALSSSFGKTSFMGALFAGMGGGRASGGPVSSGMAYLVGESGPEVFMPGSSGSIAPNGALGGVHTTNIIDARGADAGVEQRVRRAIAESERRSVATAVATVTDRQARR